MSFRSNPFESIISQELLHFADLPLGSFLLSGHLIEFGLVVGRYHALEVGDFFLELVYDQAL